MNSNNNVFKILLVVVSALLVLVMSFLIVNQVGSYLRIKTQISLEKASLELDKQRLSELESLSKQEKTMTDYIEACKKLMPDEPQEDDLIKYLQSKATDSMADFMQINFEPRVQAGSVSAMPIKISFEGNYNTLVDFLKKIRSGERAIRVDGIMVTSKGNGETDLRAEIAANAFYTSGANAVADNTAAAGTPVSTTGTPANTAGSK